MIKNIIFKLESPYRNDMKITSYEFGNKNAKKVLAIVGSTRGNEIQQIYLCSRIINMLKTLEKEDKLDKNKKIIVIPTINNFSMNINKRFWALDNTDINRMFPGYDLGETTQKIAYNVFEYVKDFEYGIQFASYYLKGKFIPHVTMMKTGYEKPELMDYFGLPFSYVRTANPYDTTTLNYNWQIWGTNAFSIYVDENEEISDSSEEIILESIKNFLINIGIYKEELKEDFYKTQHINSENILYIKSHKAGILKTYIKLGQYIKKGDLIGEVFDPYEYEVLEKITSPYEGIVYFIYNRPLINSNSNICRVIKKD